MNKTALIIEPYGNDHIVIEDLNTSGYSLISVTFEDVSRIYPPFKHSKLKENITFSVTNKMINSVPFLVQYMIPKYSKIIENNRISLIVPTHKTNDINFLIVGHLNQVFKFPGLNKKQARFWYRKSRYLKHFKSLGFKTPNILQIVPMKEYPDTLPIQSFPVICKPDCGSGGEGVYVAKSPKELDVLFQPADKNEPMSEFAKLFRQRDQFGRRRNYLFTLIRSNYLIEEFIPGSVISVAGIKAINGIEVSLIYEIKPSNLPFRSENEFLAPFDKIESLERVRSIVPQMIKQSVFPLGPFMLDFILDSKGDLYLIDAAPRLSATAIQFFGPCYADNSYVTRSISALLEKRINIQKRDKPLVYVYSKRLPLPKGQLIRFSQKESFSEYVIDWQFYLKPGEKIFQERNDSFTERKGHITVIGKDIQEAKKRWSQEYKKLEILIDTFPNS
ncbi:MAG: hypothetical protein OXN83_02075 [Oligoflexia bacterium]|nr:hypothetical protein [Oligoflexia bacterium]